jgi:hypothetical protein
MIRMVLVFKLICDGSGSCGSFSGGLSGRRRLPLRFCRASA